MGSDFGKSKARVRVAGGVLAAGGRGWETLEAACKYVHTKIVAHMRGKVLSVLERLLGLSNFQVMDGLIYVVGGGDGKDWLCSAEVHFHSSQYKPVPG